jgi:hypothetical protein
MPACRQACYPDCLGISDDRQSHVEMVLREGMRQKARPSGSREAFFIAAATGHDALNQAPRIYLAEGQKGGGWLLRCR